jgi:uncharacterized protein YbaP (TraB family)
MSKVIRILFLAAAVTFVSDAAFAMPPTWVVHHGRATLTLFGSVHLLPTGLGWRPPALEAALAGADEMWFELPIDAATADEADALVDKLGGLPAGDTLSAHLGPGQNARLDRIAQDLGLPMAVLEQTRPWEAEVVVSLADDAKHGALADQGVEQQLAASTPPSVRRRAFETPRQQIEFLAGAPMAAQVASLDETLGEIDTQPHLYEDIVAAWMAGDTAALEKEALDPLRQDSPQMYQRLVAERNRRWAKVIVRLLGGDKRVVVVVGVDHMLGADGLPALLRAQGYAVEGPR